MANDKVETAVDPVAAADIAGSIAAHDMSAWGMFIGADIVVQLIIILLLLASFWSWGIIFEKWMSYGNANRKANKFENDFWSAEALDTFYERLKKKRDRHPMSQIFMDAMEEWFRSRDDSGTSFKGGSSFKLGTRERISQIMGVTRNRELDRLERGLGFLATVGSSAPFVGLFGTVWGIMNSFQSIAVSKNTSLAVVAPGIAEALFATAIGLFAAIPAVIAYNKFSNALDKFAGKLENFSVEFNTLLSRQIEG